MLNELKPIFEKIDQTVFNEETLEQLSTIVEAKVNEKVEARVVLEKESALKEQEEDFSNKMQHLVETIKTNIDKDHTAKVKFVVESLNKDHLSKLIKLKENYEKLLKDTAVSHKNQLVESVDQFLEQYIDKNIPRAVIEEAARNTHVKNLLEEARKVLAVDDRYVKQNIKEAIVDGKNQVDRLIRENAELRKGKVEAEAKRLLVEKTSHLPANVAKFVRSRLAGKTPKFIAENFDYVVDMFTVQEKKHKTSLINEGHKLSNVDRSKISGDANIVIESNANNTPSYNSNPLMDEYMSVLNARN